MIRAIAAIDDKRGIAAPGVPPWNIPWDIPEEKARYRQLIAHANILMGKNTYHSRVPRSDKRNIVASTTLEGVDAPFELIRDVDAFFQQNTEDLWIIGGADMYASTLKYCDELYITHVVGDFGCNRFFPGFENFTLREKSPMHEQNGYKFYYAIYTKPVV